jgi:RNA polymerase sigma factor (sigma-70 family)
MTSFPGVDGNAGGSSFATTHWSVVRRAGTSIGEEASGALETLCRTYWYPLYAFIRRMGNSPEDAQDVTQSFFAYLLEKGLIGRAQPEAGRFRSFLLGSLKNFMANDFRRQHAQKRGGAAMVISFDAQSAEQRYLLEPVELNNPQTLFQQTWAVEVLDQAFLGLESEYQGGGKSEIFQALHRFLQGDRGAQTYAQIGASLGMSEGAVKVAVHRMRQRYRELLRAAVANTVSDPIEVDDELRNLMEALSGR